MTKTLLPVLKWITNLLPFGRYTLYRYIAKLNFGEFTHKTGASHSFDFICNIKDPVSRTIYFSDTMEPQFISIIENYLKPEMSFIDIGASWGYYSMLASKIVGEKGIVIALEPDARYSSLLKRNIELNSITNITTYKIAAGQENGFIYMDPQIKLASELWEIPRAITKANDRSNLVPTECKKLDDILWQSSCEPNNRISFLKMNIEGAEFEALSGMSEGLKNMMYERMLIEFHPPWLEERGTNTEILVNNILSSGYRGWWIRRTRTDVRRLMYSKGLPNPNDFLLEMLDGVPPNHDVWPCAYFRAKDILN